MEVNDISIVKKFVDLKILMESFIPGLQRDHRIVNALWKVTFENEKRLIDLNLIETITLIRVVMFDF